MSQINVSQIMLTPGDWDRRREALHKRPRCRRQVQVPLVPPVPEVPLDVVVPRISVISVGPLVLVHPLVPLVPLFI